MKEKKDRITDAMTVYTKKDLVRCTLIIKYKHHIHFTKYLWINREEQTNKCNNNYVHQIQFQWTLYII